MYVQIVNLFDITFHIGFLLYSILLKTSLAKRFGSSKVQKIEPKCVTCMHNIISLLPLNFIYTIPVENAVLKI